ncbi:S8 family serine peptidase [Haloimpatiens sp. FM7330]|uniref:S8 family serine peptidase n=1 Tax=Haloimpatiens sp. FM7330 TaxID=3298610 RepID=UPI00363A9B11
MSILFSFSQNFVSVNAIESSNLNSNKKHPKYVSNEIIIKYKNKSKSINTKAISNGITKKLSPHTELVKFKDDINVDAVIKNIKNNKNIELVQPNYIYKTNSISNDAMVDNIWGLFNYGQVISSKTGLKGVDINIKNAWNITKGSSNVVVAVIDTGIDINHPELKDRIWTNPNEIANNGIDDDGNGYIDDINGWNFYDNNNIVHESSLQIFHGTHVAGTIAAAQNNTGIVGVAPNIKIMPLKILGTDEGTTADAIKAIEYAKSKGVKIINASWAGTEYDSALKDAIEKSGTLFVAAAGNENNNNDLIASYPASFNLNNILTVAAINNTGNLASFSNYGSTTVDVAAPGKNILSTIPLNGSYNWSYGYTSGTSMAAPYVSGVAALLLSNGITNPVDIKSRIMLTVKPLDDLAGKIFTGGIVDAYGALIGRPEYDRYSGSNRYETSAKISQAGWTTSNTAILTVGQNYADALSAAPLAKKYNAPILITDTNTLPLSIKNELNRLQVTKIFIVGGTGAVSKNIEDNLLSKNIQVIRIFGADRYATSAAVANELGNKNEVVVAYGNGFADALSIASLAAYKQLPILLVDKNAVPDTIMEYVISNSITKAYVIGGTGVISNEVLNQFPSPERIYGIDRYATNISILNRFIGEFDLNTVYFACAKDYPDALSTSALAASTSSPIILIDDNMPQIVKEFIDTNQNKINDKHAIGGRGAILDNTFLWLFN